MKLWSKPDGWYFDWGIESFQGCLGGVGFRPSTVPQETSRGKGRFAETFADTCFGFGPLQVDSLRVEFVAFFRRKAKGMQPILGAPFGETYNGWLRNPFAPTLKPWLKPLLVGVYRGIMIPWVLRWCRILSINGMLRDWCPSGFIWGLMALLFRHVLPLKHSERNVGHAHFMDTVIPPVEKESTIVILRVVIPHGLVFHTIDCLINEIKHSG